MDKVVRTQYILSFGTEGYEDSAAKLASYAQLRQQAESSPGNIGGGGAFSASGGGGGVGAPRYSGGGAGGSVPRSPIPPGPTFGNFGGPDPYSMGPQQKLFMDAEGSWWNQGTGAGPFPVGQHNRMYQRAMSAQALRAAESTAGDYGYGFGGVSSAGAGGVRGRPGMNMPGDESWVQSRMAGDQQRQQRRDFIMANSQRGVAAGGADWNDDAGGGGGPRSGLSRFWSGTGGEGRGEEGFASQFKGTILSPERWGAHMGWLLQSAIMYQVTGLISTVFEGVGTLVKTSLDAASTSSKIQMITGQGGGAAGGMLSGMLSAGAAYGMMPSDMFGIAPQLVGLGMATPGGVGGLTRAAASSAAYGLTQSPLQAAQLMARAGGTYGMAPMTSQDLMLRAMRGGATDPAATFQGGMGLAGSGAMGVGASTGLIAAIQRTTGLDATSAAAIASAVQANSQTGVYTGTVIPLPGGGTRPAGMDTIMAGLSQSYASGTAAQRQGISGLAGEENRMVLQRLLSSTTFADAQKSIAGDSAASRDAILAERGDVGLNLKRMGANVMNYLTNASGDPYPNSLQRTLGGIGGAIGGAVNFLGYYGQSAQERARQSQDLTYAEHDKRMADARGTGAFAGQGPAAVKSFSPGGVMTVGEFDRLNRLYEKVETTLTSTPGYNAEANRQTLGFTVLGSPGNPMSVKVNSYDTVALAQAQQLASMGIAGVYNIPNFDLMNAEGYAARVGFQGMNNSKLFPGASKSPIAPSPASTPYSAYQDYRAGERGSYASSSSAAVGESQGLVNDVYLDGNKVGVAMSNRSSQDSRAAIQSGYSAGTGNAPQVGSPMP